MAVMLTDYSQDASWRLRIEVETAGGGFFVLGAVDTIPVRASAIVIPNRVVAVCSVPGALQWKVFADLLAGTPQKNKTSVIAELKVSSVPEYAAGCCPLVAIPGASTDVNSPPNQTPDGPPPQGQRVLIYAGSGFAVMADVALIGVDGAGAYVQMHDAGPSDVIGDATMVGIGFPVSAPLNQTILLDWTERRRRFNRGFTLASSSAQNTYSASLFPISAFGQWDVA